LRIIPAQVCAIRDSDPLVVLKPAWFVLRGRYLIAPDLLSLI